MRLANLYNKSADGSGANDAEHRQLSGRLLYWLFLALTLIPPSAPAACLPLPDDALAPLAAKIETNPQQALREAQARLAQMPRSSPASLGAQLYSVVAESELDLDDPGKAAAAITQGLTLLQSSQGTPTASSVRLRFQLLQAELQSTAGDAAKAAATLDALLPTLPSDSRELACALSQRAIAYDFLDEPDHAVNAALAAHRLAVDHEWVAPRIESAYTLAVNFRRTGLYDQAEKMIDEVIAVETANHMQQSLSDAQYERGQVLVAAGRLAEARSALTDARDAARAAGDQVSAAAVNIPLCLAEINDRDLSAADVTCNSGSEALIAAQRVDLATLLHAYQAKLQLEHHHPEEALATLNRLLAGPIHRLLPTQEADIYRDRGRARGELHRYAEAYADLSYALQLDAASGIERRHRQVAMLSALVESERLRTNNRLLEADLRARQQDLQQQQRARLLWRAVAAASVIACGLLVCLLVARKRHARRLRRYHIVLSHAWSRAPHAMMLLDENRLVFFANRPLLGSGPAPVVGAALGEVIPRHLLAQITQAIESAFSSGRFVSLDIEMDQGDVPKRYYEVYVLPAIDGSEALGVTLQSIDVTELRSVERQFVDNNSRERQQLGDELHEGLAQELAGVLFMLNNLSNRLKRESTGYAQLVTEASEQVARSISLTRRLAQEIAPIAIERGSLADALKRLAGSVGIRLGAAVSCECVLDERSISNLAADHVHRFCRDALIEAALDEACHEIRLEVHFVRDSLVIELCGDRRVEPPSGSKRSECPTQLLAFRARLLGGKLVIDPSRANEFRLTLTVPSFQLQDRVGSDFLAKPYSAL